MQYLLIVWGLIAILNAYGGETKDGHTHKSDKVAATAALVPFQPGPEPREALRPIPGELSFFQLPLNGFSLGEAGVIVGPDGTVVLLDLGNFRHDGIVRDFVRNLNTNDLTPERGYSRRRGALEVDWIIITHFHWFCRT